MLTEREIPVLFLSKDEYDSEKKPVVFLIHGGGMSDVSQAGDPWAKEGWFDAKYHDVPYTLAEGGLLVALIDHWWAGERFKPEYRDIVRHNYLGSVIHGFTETARSGGGIVSLMAAAHEPRVTAVASWVGGPDMMAWARMKMTQGMIDFALKKSPEITDQLKEFDPIYRLESMAPTAVLMINNRNDPAVPVHTAEELYESLKPLYSEIPEKLKLHVLEPDEATHAMTEADYDEGCAWLIEHLRSEGLDSEELIDIVCCAEGGEVLL